MNARSVMVVVVLAGPASVVAQSLQIVRPPQDGARSTAVGLSDDGSLVAVQGKLVNEPRLGARANADVACRFDTGAPQSGTQILADVAQGPIGVRGFAHGGAGFAPNAFLAGFDAAAGRAFLYRHASNTTVLLPPLAGDAFSTPRGVSLSGVVVGRSGPGSGAGAEAVRWDNGVPTGLGLPSGADPSVDSTFAYDIADDDTTIVGVYAIRTIRTVGTTPVYNVDSFPFVHTNGQYTLLPNLPQSPSSTNPPRDEGVAYATNADGTVVVGRSYVGTGREAFRWTAATGAVGLGYLPSAVALDSQANAVSADGRVVVGWSRSGAPGAQSAFVWDPVNGMRRLDTLLESLGVSLQRWVLVSAEDISADGTVIAGLAENAAGESQGFVVTLPRGSAPLREFGTAAPWTGGVLRIDADPLPRLGLPGFDLRFFDAPASADVFWLLGFRELAVPIDLAASLGLPQGAMLYQAVATTGTIRTDTSGRARLPVGPVSNDPTLAGASLFLQSGVLDTGLSAPLPLAFSRGTEIVIGL